MIKLKEVGILSYGYIVALVAAFLCFIQALFIVPMVNTIIGILSEAGELDTIGMGIGSSLPTWLTIVLIISLPIFGAIYGFIFGCIGAIVYNLAAKITGGIELSFEKAQPRKRKPARRHSNVIIEEEPVASVEAQNQDSGNTEYAEDVVEIAEE
ncbi:MAG: DUF3566 domain-containing protein [Caldisericia bacterium]|nr:DUF3566 domain-containing protein [Caldisericia bacterium]